MDRKTALVVLRVAGYHSDRQTWMRIYCENRVSYTAANEEWRRGQQMRAAGVKCSCHECNKPA